MTDKAVSALTSLTGANTATGDLLYIVDISEAAAADRSKKITVGDIHVSIPNGTNSAPSIAFASDPNTGIYRVDADKLGFAAGGSADQMVLTTTGLGIGTNNPGAKLDVDGTVRAQIAGGGTGRYLDIGSDGSGITRFFNNYAGGGDFGFVWKIGASNRMTLDASGNLGIGTTSPNSPAGSTQITLHISNGTAGTSPGIHLTNGDTGTNAGDGTLIFVGDAANKGTTSLNIYNQESSPICFFTATTEKARITSGGYFKASDNGSYNNVAGTYHEFYQTANSEGLIVRNVNASNASDVLSLKADRNTTNNSYYFIRADVTGVAYRFQVADSGDVTNTNGTYGTISDAKMKTDIVDAGSQWSDIKALRFRKFKMKDDPSGLVQLGVVAQEVELISPGLVDEHADKDAEGNDLGTTTKSVKTSVLLMKAAVALQEAMARIEKLEAEVAALKGA